ncbi:ATP-binding protein [Kitasatospora sp. NPDC085879]|uniref:AlbA family DNA-binding domain-containing protein n=1 Tax=Kitasatospora sp. NPDC085879 TaxID=3154769 RepID=UPI00342DDC16
MPNLGQTGTAELAELLDGHEKVRARLVLVADGDQWQLHHGEVVLDDADTVQERIWRYEKAAFLELPAPGSTVAALLRGESQDVAGLRVILGERGAGVSVERLRGSEERGPTTTPWPRIEWTVHRSTTTANQGYDVLVGDGTRPSFVSFDHAMSAFLHQRPYDSRNRTDQLWRVVEPQHGAWLRKVTVAADRLIAEIEGEALGGVVLELSEPAGHQHRAVEGPGAYSFDLPEGLRPESLLIAYRDGQWLDMRHFPAPQYGFVRDASVVWEQPGSELDVLLAAGEGRHLECKETIQTEHAERKKVLKTIAAFASQDGGGTVLFGVRDDLTVKGLPKGQTEDTQTLQVVNMIRNGLEPEPPYTYRMIEHDHRRVLVLEIVGGGQMYGLRDGQGLEFYVRRGPNTVLARHNEIADGFRQ